MKRALLLCLPFLCLLGLAAVGKEDDLDENTKEFLKKAPPIKLFAQEPNDEKAMGIKSPNYKTDDTVEKKALVKELIERGRSMKKIESARTPEELMARKDYLEIMKDKADRKQINEANQVSYIHKEAPTKEHLARQEKYLQEMSKQAQKLAQMKAEERELYLVNLKRSVFGE